MKKLFLTIALVLMFAVGANAGTNVFVGGGLDFTAFNSEGKYEVDKDWGFSGGIMKTLSPKFSTFTTYDYVVTKATNGDNIEKTLFEYEVLGSVGYLLNSPEDKLQFRLLAGIEITDGNLPDYGTLLSYAHGGIISYSFSDKTPNIWLAGTMSLTDGYYDGRLRAGLLYNIDGLLGLVF